MQEVGLKKGEFSETLVVNMSKRASTPIRRDARKGALWASCIHKRPNEDDIDVYEERQALEKSNFNEEFGLHDIVD